jgi:restriction system protein
MTVTRELNRSCFTISLAGFAALRYFEGTEMGRRKGELTLLIEAASKWPWKVSATLVPVSFIACHLVAVAVNPGVPVTGLGDMGFIVIRAGAHTFAAILQYILPMIFLVTAVSSFVRRSRSVALFNDVRGDPTKDIASLSWQDFETLVGEGFRHRGFEVTERGGAGPDGGVDLALTKGHERFLVQCKQWRARQVSVSVVRELYGVMAAERVAAGYVVTSGTFTKDAKEFAAGRNIELMDGKVLEALLRDGRSAATARVPKNTVIPPAKAAPTCPKCKTPMVARTAKKGSNVGSSFWGCAQYPKCRHTVAIG